MAKRLARSFDYEGREEVCSRDSRVRLVILAGTSAYFPRFPEQEDPMTSPWSLGRKLPELPLLAYGFVLHFIWEYFQCPLFFVGMAGTTHLQMCLQATVGDVNILLVAFWGTALVSQRHRAWMDASRRWERVTFVGIGVAVTIAYELLATQVWNRWTYSDAMPVLLGVGLVPIAQWLVIPPVVLWLARRRVSLVIAASSLVFANESSLRTIGAHVAIANQF